MIRRLRQWFCRHRDGAIDFTDGPPRWIFECGRCGFIRELDMRIHPGAWTNR